MADVLNDKVDENSNVGEALGVDEKQGLAKVTYLEHKNCFLDEQKRTN